MTKIKVCYLLNDLDIGGVSRVVYEIVTDIDFHRFEVSFITLRDNLEFARQVKLPPQIDIYTFNYFFDTDYSLRRYFKLIFFPSIIKSRAQLVLNKIRNINPDILHMHVLPREIIIGILAKKAQRNLHLIYTDHSLRISDSESTLLKRNLLALLYRKLYKKVHVVAVSKSVQRSQQRFKWLNGKNHNILIENRINIKNYPHKVYRDVESVQVVYVARLSHAKGHLELLKAWEIVQSPGFTLKLIGGGYLEDEIKTHIRKQGLNGVQLVGNVGNVVDHLLESDIAVFPSEKEGLPIALLEKMAVGLPVIVSDIPALLDFIENKENGLVYRLGSSTQLASKLELLRKDANLRHRIGCGARHSLMERIGKQTITELACQHYFQVLNSNPEGSA